MKIYSYKSSLLLKNDIWDNAELFQSFELYNLGTFNHLGLNGGILLEYLKALNFHCTVGPCVSGISVFNWAWTCLHKVLWLGSFLACDQWPPPSLLAVVASAFVSQARLWFRNTGGAMQKYSTLWLWVEVWMYFSSFLRDSNVPPGLRIACLGL